MNGGLPPNTKCPIHSSPANTTITSSLAKTLAPIKRNRIHVRQQLDEMARILREPKTKAAVRYVELPPEVMGLLREHALASGRRGLVWCTRTGNGYAQASWGRDVSFPALKRAEVPRVRIHDLRHTCASMLIAAGLPVTVVSAHLGHANPGITLRIYAHLFSARGTTGVAEAMGWGKNGGNGGSAIEPDSWGVVKSLKNRG